MQINNQSLQDMHLFGDPLHMPIVIVEHIISAPLRTTSLNSYFNHLGQKDTRSVLTGPSFKAMSRSFRDSPQQDDPVLKIVVFVHGFQACSTSPHAPCLYYINFFAYFIVFFKVILLYNEQENLVSKQ